MKLNLNSGVQMGVGKEATWRCSWSSTGSLYGGGHPIKNSIERKLWVGRVRCPISVSCELAPDIHTSLHSARHYH